MKENKSQLLSTKKAIIKWLDKHKVKNYTINDDLSVDVNCNVDISRKNLKFIPINFRNVTGFFWCGYNKLISLSGSPKSVSGDFWCSHNQLTNLIGSPKTVEGHFDCVFNKLINLIGSTETVGLDFSGLLL